MHSSKVAVTASAVLGKALTIIGYIGSIFFLIILIVSIVDPSIDEPGTELGMNITFIILVVVFVLLILKGYQITRRIVRFKRYISRISEQHITSLERLAAIDSRSVDFVIKDLQKMIDKKFFTNAFIDIATNKIVVGNKPGFSSGSVSQQIQNSAQTEMEPYVCSGCGASGVKPKGALAVCEYCGSVVK